MQPIRNPPSGNLGRDDVHWCHNDHYLTLAWRNSDRRRPTEDSRSGIVRCRIYSRSRLHRPRLLSQQARAQKVGRELGQTGHH